MQVFTMRFKNRLLFRFNQAINFRKMVRNGQRTLTVVTGASRGIGREITHQIACRVGEKSAFLITSRDESKLLTLKKEIRERNESALVWIVVCDMGNVNEEAKQSFEAVLKEITATEPFDQLYLFHNAGTIGDVSAKATELSDPLSWTSYLNINFVSMVIFNNLVLKWITPKIAKNRCLVNVTSLCAIAGFPSLTQYSCGKAVREAFFRAIASEDSTLKVLSYSPGPVYTEMHDAIAEQSFDSEIRKVFAKGAAETSDVKKETLSPEQSITRLMQILERDVFESGTRIDYFDEQEGEESEDKKSINDASSDMNASTRSIAGSDI